MAKMQRWRRGRNVEEDTPSTTGVPTPDAEDPDTESAEALVLETPETLSDITGDPAPVGVNETVASDEADTPDDPDHAPDEVDPDHDDDGDAMPALPKVVERHGLSGLLFGGRSVEDVFWVQLLQAAHAKQAVTTSLAMGLAAAVSGRPAREAGVVLLTVLVGQCMLGWHNDIVDRHRDAAHGLTGKPLAQGRLSAETVWYAIVVAACLLVPLAITTGIKAGCIYLASVMIGVLGNILLRTGIFSWWSWAASFALLPMYLSYGGWGGQADGSGAEPAIVILAALLGIGVHFMRSVWGLVADNEDGWTYLPLKLGLKVGATRLLALSTLYTAIVAIAIIVMGAKVGLSR